MYVGYSVPPQYKLTNYRTHVLSSVAIAWMGMLLDILFFEAIRSILT